MWRPLIVGAVVAFDASLVEVVAVRAGLWSWAEPGHLGVPLIGMLGWGYFAIGADAALGRGRRLAAVVAAPAAAHALIQLTWWGAFRWGLRRDLGSASVAGMAVIGVLDPGGPGGPPARRWDPDGCGAPADGGGEPLLHAAGDDRARRDRAAGSTRRRSPCRTWRRRRYAREAAMAR